MAVESHPADDLRSSYARGALATESDLADTVGLDFPLKKLAKIVLLAREMDLLKRQVFYVKKPDLARVEAFTKSKEEFRHFVERAGYVSLDQCGLPPRILHAMLGRITELGEMLDMFLTAVVMEEPIDWDNLFEEMGDDEWYAALMRDEARRQGQPRFTQSAIQAANVAKLAKRYSKGDAAGHDVENRDRGAEQAALKGE